MATRPIWPDLVGKVILSSAVQASLGALELPSPTIIHGLVTTQKAADVMLGEIRAYLFIGTLWAIGTTLIVWMDHYYLGACLNLTLNILAMFWIISRRYRRLKENAVEYGFKVDGILTF